MTKVFCFVAFLLCPIFLIAQSGSNNLPDSTKLPDSVLYKKLNQNFAGLATGQSDAIALTNYGSFEPINGEFKLNIFGPIGKIQKKKAAFFSVNVGGKLIGDNSAIIFSNSKFNSEMNAGLKIHLPPLKIENHFKRSNELDILVQIDEEYRKYLITCSQAQLDYDSTYLNIRLRHTKTRRDTVIANLITMQNAHDSLLSALQNTPQSDTPGTLNITTALLELHKRVRQTIIDISSLNAQIAIDSVLVAKELARTNAATRIWDSAHVKYLRLKDSLEMTLDTKGTQATWLSLVGDIGRRKYYLFHNKLPFPEQLEEKKFSTGAVGIELNFAGYSKKSRSVLFGPIPNFYTGNIGITRIWSNNIADFSSVEFSDALKYVSGDSTHNLTTKHQVYIDSISAFQAWHIYSNFYRTFGKKQSLAWHVFADVEFRNNDQNPVNAGAGFLMAIKNKKNSNVLNIELYGKLVDIGKALPTDESQFLKRNEIGINIGIPINIPTFK